jgi:hypothetical protein
MLLSAFESDFLYFLQSGQSHNLQSQKSDMTPRQLGIKVDLRELIFFAYVYNVQKEGS